MSKPIVDFEKVYADGSGAPATVVASGYYLSADYIRGDVRLESVTGRSVPRRVLEAARRAYLKALRLHRDTSAAWFDANLAMYAK